MNAFKCLLAGAIMALPLAAGAAELEVCNPAGIRSDGKYVDHYIREAMEKEHISKPPLAARFTPGDTEKISYSTSAETEINRLFLLRGWGDGLPIVLPTPERVEKMMEGCDFDADDVVARIKPLDGKATVRKIAANAVMAGCRPEHFPFVLAAVKALANEDFDSLGPATTTGVETPLLIISGPAAEQAGLDSGTGTMGRGVYGNPAIGRALNLVIQNIGGSVPGVTDMSNHGNPGEFGMCVVENQKADPWDSPMVMDEGYPARANVVTIASVGSMRQIIYIGLTNEQLLDEAALAMRSHKGRHEACVWLLPPDAAKELHKAGFTRESLKQEIKKRLGDNGPDDITICVTGGPGEKNLVFDGWYAMKKVSHSEVELPAMWDSLIDEAKIPAK